MMASELGYPGEGLKGGGDEEGVLGFATKDISTVRQNQQQWSIQSLSNEARNKKRKEKRK